MKCTINDQVVLSRPPEGPIAAHIRAFAESGAALGYARSSLQREIRLAAGFETYILIGNFGTTAASVRATFLRASGPPLVENFTVDASKQQQ